MKSRMLLVDHLTSVTTANRVDLLQHSLIINLNDIHLRRPSISSDSSECHISKSGNLRTD